MSSTNQTFKVIVHFLNHQPEEIEADLENIAKKLLAMHQENKTPIYIVCKKDKLPYSRNHFHAFAYGNMDYREFLDVKTIDDAFQNINQIEIDNIQIDPGALWYKTGTLIYFDNDDQYHEMTFKESLFKKL